MSISILKSPKLRHKFCTKWNRIFGCKDVYMCGVACPLWGCFHSECLMNDKNYPLGEAVRQTIRESISKGEGRKIIRDLIENRHKPYPPEGWQKKFMEKEEKRQDESKTK